MRGQDHRSGRRFQAKVKVGGADECWPWTRNRKGYGKFKLSGEMMLAHRASWLLHRGAIPTDRCVLHRCDNPVCVNPAHLFLGTALDIAAIRASPLNSAQLAKLYPLARSTIRAIKNGTTWR